MSKVSKQKEVSKEITNDNDVKIDLIDVFDKWEELSLTVNQKENVFPSGFTFLSSGKILISYSNTREYKTFYSANEALMAVNKELNEYTKQRALP